MISRDIGNHDIRDAIVREFGNLAHSEFRMCRKRRPIVAPDERDAFSPPQSLS